MCMMTAWGEQVGHDGAKNATYLFQHCQYLQTPCSLSALPILQTPYSLSLQFAQASFFFLFSIWGAPFLLLYNHDSHICLQGLITRTSLYEQAVILALLPFLQPEHYGSASFGLAANSLSQVPTASVDA